jgi:hypothetical protein
MGILPMSEGLTQTHGQDARATSGIQMLPSIGRCAPLPDGLSFLSRLGRESVFGKTVVLQEAQTS